MFGVVLVEKRREEDMLRNFIYLFIIILLIILYQIISNFHFLHYIMYLSEYFLDFFHLRLIEKRSAIKRPKVLRVLRVDRQILRVDRPVLRVDKRVLRVEKRVLRVLRSGQVSTMSDKRSFGTLFFL